MKRNLHFLIIIFLTLSVSQVTISSATVNWNNEGLNLHNQGRYLEALDAYDKALAINPNDPDAWYNMGNTLATLGRYDEAIQAYDRSLAINPNDADVWNNKGTVYDTLGKYPEALQAYEKALQIRPNKWNTWYNKGWVYKQQGKYSDAVFCFKKALEFNPSYADAKEELIIAQQALITPSPAQSTTVQIIQTITPNSEISNIISYDDKFWTNKGNLLYGDKKYEQSIDAYNNALAINPNNLEAQEGKLRVQSIISSTTTSTSNTNKTPISFFTICISLLFIGLYYKIK